MNIILVFWWSCNLLLYYNKMRTGNPGISGQKVVLTWNPGTEKYSQNQKRYYSPYPKF